MNWLAYYYVLVWCYGITGPLLVYNTWISCFLLQFQSYFFILIHITRHECDIIWLLGISMGKLLAVFQMLLVPLYIVLYYALHIDETIGCQNNELLLSCFCVWFRFHKLFLSFSFLFHCYFSLLSFRVSWLDALVVLFSGSRRPNRILCWCYTCRFWLWFESCLEDYGADLGTTWEFA